MHISLDSALGRQRRLNSVGESVLQIAPSAAAAYSLRSLTGGDPRAVRVRRDTDGGAGDNDEQDFTASEVSSGALVAFVGSGNDGFVETWYDQSGNSNDAVQATAAEQPQIVNAGSLVTGGLDFDGTDDFLELESIVGATNSQSIFGVVKLDALDGSTEMILDNRDGNGDGAAYFAGSNEFRYLFDINSPIAQLSASTDQSIVSAFKTSSDVAIGIDGGTLDTASNTETISVAAAPRIGSRSFSSPSAFFAGEIAELILYNTDKSANRASVETNINSHYSIY